MPSPRTCRVADCGRAQHARGLCNTHYAGALRSGTLPPERTYLPPGQTRPCSIADCGRSAEARGLCDAHYLRVWEHGDVRSALPIAVRERDLRPLPERFWSRVDTSGGLWACWPWTRGRNGAGYGLISQQHRDVSAHRLSWELANGPIPPGLYVCHTCDNPPCCNPSHLFLGTPTDNVRDMYAKGRHSTRKAA
jgi:hypothetical protein